MLGDFLSPQKTNFTPSISSMAKNKTAWFCKECGYESPKWVGKCSSCGSWNTFVEEVIVANTHKPAYGGEATKNRPVLIHSLETQQTPRLDLRSQELNRVLGGGLVPGSMVLIGGEPGIGKSTLVLQLSLRLKDVPILYVSGEESYHQLKMRADRIGISNQHCHILAETNLDNILNHAKELKPAFVVIDSIQTIASSRADSSPGSVTQIRESTAEMLQFAKSNNTPFLLIGHITKEGSIAGPKILEHMVDAVLQFEGDQHNLYRILRAIKNRFGSTSEIGIFEMQHKGLREIHNPSELLLTHRDEEISGISVAASMEGNRSILIETQALVSSAAYGNPQRSSIGMDVKRLNMLLAVLEKRVGFKLASKDVFLNLAGGVKSQDPSIDLAALAAVLSSDLNIPINQHVCFAGEVGLSGEVRPVARIEQRITEAQKLGFRKIFLSKYHESSLDTKKYQIPIRFIGQVNVMFKELFS